ncbi:MAG TPA: hypothetical protein VEC11_17935 [Allosphingosinicella sp.]|nr:hypothetical protein [Allosphingosinicella sp.]
MDIGQWGWKLLIIGGPLLLAIVLAWAVIRNRRARTPDEVTEAGTRRVYDEEERRGRAGTDDAES